MTGADVFAGRLGTDPQRSYFLVGHFYEGDWDSPDSGIVGELASHRSRKRAHISLVCHPCGSGAWRQLG